MGLKSFREASMDTWNTLTTLHIWGEDECLIPRTGTVWVKSFASTIHMEQRKLKSDAKGSAFRPSPTTPSVLTKVLGRGTPASLSSWSGLGQRGLTEKRGVREGALIMHCRITEREAKYEFDLLLAVCNNPTPWNVPGASNCCLLA